jgi:Zn-dependent metalloprotease
LEERRGGSGGTVFSRPLLPQAAWPHFTQIVGTHFSDEADALTDIICSYADVFTMLAQQHDLHQDEKTSDWVLIRGYVDWLNGKNPTKPYEGTPFISFKEPGRAYTGTVSGNDRQVAHMRDYVHSKFGIERRYINSGILNKAFYLVATKRTTKLAAEIWIATLRQIVGGRLKTGQWWSIQNQPL